MKMKKIPCSMCSVRCRDFSWNKINIQWKWKKYPVACVQLGVVIFHGINSILNDNDMKNHPVAGVQFCEVWDVPEQCEDHHWNDVDCTGEACEPEARENI